jgi:hypothetical protein
MCKSARWYRRCNTPKLIKQPSFAAVILKEDGKAGAVAMEF